MASSPPEHFPTQYWHRVDEERVCCDVCPRKCTLREGKRGACFVRMNQDQKIVLTSYGRSSGFCIDPIEKKPLNHFYPGSRVLSFGTAGCNLSCQFCQNWDISKSRHFDTLCDNAMPDELAKTALKYECKSIAFTYNDPVVFLEYAVDTAQASAELGLKNVAVTAGYINDDPREEFFRYMDAANIDLKGFTDHFYKKVCHGELQPVLDSLCYLKHETNVWFEITTLLIPDENDSDKELHHMCQWIVDHLGTEVPLHFSAFHPDFKMQNIQRTPLDTLLRARAIALSYGIKFVYCGNVHHTESDTTYCPACAAQVIVRDWYQLGKYGLDNQGNCLNCGFKLAGRFNGPKGNFGPRRIPVTIHPLT